MDTFQSSIYFIDEQSGEIEEEFKDRVSIYLKKFPMPIRAYLCKVSYSMKFDPTCLSVALCIMENTNSREKIKIGISSIFREMFNTYEHLDVIFLDKILEYNVRQVCRPFVYTGKYDFVLSSSEGHGLADLRTCVALKWYEGDHHDGYLLVAINPCIIGQEFGLGSRDIDNVILASRHQGFSLNPVSEWPVSVHVALPLIDLSRRDKRLVNGDLGLIAWGELFQKIEDVPNWLGKQ